ncbi:MAG: flavin reductase domain protein FMN-binding protein [Gemmatimonadetes bacterium]|jgi:flavin reductase (DIM6/NTAB) family NADH-FMN oxidoreductase RutF|nr:flavin reductase domain protein FMN-binding protein [Gemmatimonadota bacterium]
MTIDSDSFRSVLGRFASGITVVTTVDASGRDVGMTVSAFSSVSLHPPLVQVCIDKAASMYAALMTAERFGINILSSEQESLSRRFAAVDSQHRFEGVGYARGESGVVLLTDALAHIECRRQAHFDAGDHTLFIGEVERATAGDGRPMLYYRGGYAQLER